LFVTSRGGRGAWGGCPRFFYVNLWTHTRGREKKKRDEHNGVDHGILVEWGQWVGKGCEEAGRKGVEEFPAGGGKLGTLAYLPSFAVGMGEGECPETSMIKRRDTGWTGETSFLPVCPLFHSSFVVFPYRGGYGTVDPRGRSSRWAAFGFRGHYRPLFMCAGWDGATHKGGPWRCQGTGPMGTRGNKEGRSGGLFWVGRGQGLTADPVRIAIGGAELRAVLRPRGLMGLLIKGYPEGVCVRLAGGISRLDGFSPTIFGFDVLDSFSWEAGGTASGRGAN